MAHELNNADAARLVLRKKAAWHGLGNVIEDDLSAVEAGENFGLFDPIEGWGLAAVRASGYGDLAALGDALEAGDLNAALHSYRSYQSKSLPVNTHKANVMVSNVDGIDTTELLGVVGSSYQTCQNRELAEFTDALAQTGKVVIETAGTIRGGKKIWFLARGESFEVGGTDKMYSYVLVSNAHDGTSAIRVTPTTVRVVCSNTLHMVIPRNEEGSTRVNNSAISLRHSGDLSKKLEEARHAIKHYGSVLETNKALFEKLREKQIGEKEALKFFAGEYTRFGWAVPTEAELNDPAKSVRKLAERRREKMDQAAEDFLKRWNEEKATAGGESAWLAFNALTGVIQHDIGSRGKNDEKRVENRLKSNLFGVNASRSQEILETALNIAV
jgi:phage/plasmid-like protein (TIGR03299 family)